MRVSAVDALRTFTGGEMLKWGKALMALLRRLSADQWRSIRHWSMEFVVVAFGVLAALAAQEFAQALHWKNEVRQTREALDAELAHDMAAFEYRAAQRPCVAARLAELDRWARSFRTGAPLHLSRSISIPPEFVVRTTVWDVIDGEAVSRIPLDARLNYAGFYQYLKYFSEITDAESTHWDTLLAYENSSKLSEADQLALHRAIGNLNDSNSSLEILKTSLEGQANALRIRPERSIESSANPMIAQGNERLCLRLL